MGIKGMLNLVKPIIEKKHLSDFKGKRVAIDGLSWIYRGFYGMIYEEKPQIEKTLFFITKMIEMFNQLSIKVIIVLDGNSLDAKTETKKERENQRKKYEEKRKNKNNDSFEKHKFKDLANKVDDNLIQSIIEFLKLINIEYIISPYESDSQMVYLQKNNFVDYLVSEDSDLILYGGDKIMFKLNNFGELEYLNILQKKLTKNFMKENPFLSDFLKMNLKEKIFCGILTGCDYMKGVKGIGMKTSINIIKNYNKEYNDVEDFFLKIKKNFNLKKDKIPINFVEKCQLCYMTFTKQLVYDKYKNKLIRFDHTKEKTIENIKNTKKYKYIGSYISDYKEILKKKNSNTSSNKTDFSIFINKFKDQSFILNVKKAINNGKFSINRLYENIEIEKEEIKKETNKKLDNDLNKSIENIDDNMNVNLNYIFNQMIEENKEINFEINSSKSPDKKSLTHFNSEMSTPISNINSDKKIKGKNFENFVLN